MSRLLAAILAGLAIPIAPSLAADIEASYSCADGTQLNATFQNIEGGPGSVKLAFGDGQQPVTLQQALSADGGRYVGSDVEFWIKGSEATLTWNGTSTTCETKPKS